MFKRNKKIYKLKMKKNIDNNLFVSYAKTVYGQEEIDAVVKCLNESTQMGNYSRQFESKIAEIFEKNIVFM